MASCYGTSGIGDMAVPNGKLRVDKCCGAYLPLRHEINFNNTQVLIELASFKDDFEIQQGFLLMNDIILEGKSWPFESVYENVEDYSRYFHSHASFAVRFCDQESYGNDIIGCFYVKPNFPGRCSHVCNGGFITNPKYRGLGVAKFMGQAFKRIAKDLGYRSSLFNLVFANNSASIGVWRSLGFKELATIPKAARLNGSEELVDALQFYYDFYEE